MARSSLARSCHQLRQLGDFRRDLPRLVSWPALARSGLLSHRWRSWSKSVSFFSMTSRFASHACDVSVWLAVIHAVVGNRLCITLPRFLDCRISLGIRSAARSPRRRRRGPTSAPKNQWYDKNSGADAQRIREHWPFMWPRLAVTTDELAPPALIVISFPAKPLLVWTRKFSI